MERVDVPVEGGALAVWRWGGGGPAVIAAHGITSSHQAWAVVGDLVASELTLLAPDLRGRGDSAAVQGPSDMRRHARDLLAVLDHLGIAEAVVAGHSMGGFVAAAFAAQHPDRTRGAVLVDGGPPVSDPLPHDADVDAVLAYVIGPALARLEERFATREAYRRFWRDHPAFRDSRVDRDRIDAYADHDLTGGPGALRSTVVADRVREDARDTLIEPGVREALATMDAPAVLLLAERGMLNDETPLYPRERVTGLRTARGPLEVIRVPDTNHYTIMLDDAGARAVAHQLRRFAGAGPAVG